MQLAPGEFIQRCAVRTISGEQMILAFRLCLEERHQPSYRGFTTGQCQLTSVWTGSWSIISFVLHADQILGRCCHREGNTSLLLQWRESKKCMQQSRDHWRSLIPVMMMMQDSVGCCGASRGSRQLKKASGPPNLIPDGALSLLSVDSLKL